MDTKYSLPVNFHEEVLKLEILIDRHREQTSHEALKKLTALYS
jgi:hypothetical protein